MLPPEKGSLALQLQLLEFAVLLVGIQSLGGFSLEEVNILCHGLKALASVPGSQGTGFECGQVLDCCLPLHPRMSALSIFVRDPSLKLLGRASLRSTEDC